MIDLSHGTIGMWAEYEETSTEGMVIPKYYPMNSIKVVKPKKMEYKVPEDAIVGPTQPSAKGQDGIPRQVVVITESSEGTPFLDKIGDVVQENVERIRSQLEEEQWKSSQERRKRREAQDNIEEEKRDKQSRKRGRKRPGSEDRPSFLDG